jgi:hypothetical protein
VLEVSEMFWNRDEISLAALERKPSWSTKKNPASGAVRGESTKGKQIVIAVSFLL